MEWGIDLHAGLEIFTFISASKSNGRLVRGLPYMREYISFDIHELSEFI